MKVAVVPWTSPEKEVTPEISRAAAETLVVNEPVAPVMLVALRLTETPIVLALMSVATTEVKEPRLAPT